ncbi:CYTH and CHAD domain-containing protein [Mycolicibacterium sp. CBMA 361]|uniref:CHAD domain-containing protein n=1 Tax=Mycolicibacterium sp. CBMA 361 TaxID=2606610 RepID=UPI0013969BA7|nr:CYTH and CHAD domain-containing protein [Mycolicibacterium sp. CBMA 361]
MERKFAVVDSTVAPSFDGLSAVGRVEQLPVAHLDAVYFDTSDHDLAAHKITLRRRTGGTDAGWHLKLPAGADARTEVRLPLTGAREGVPDELHDIVLAIVRDRPLHPVARIETERTVFMLYGPDDTAVAEFCDDRVTATAGESLQNWREWELELAGSTSSGADALDRLANRLFDAGAEPAGHGSKLAKVLAAAQSGDRLVRGQVHERLVDGSQRRYQSGLRRSLTAMRSERYFRLLDALDAIVVDGSQPAAAEEDAQPVTVGGAYRRVRKSVRRAEGAEAAGADDSDEALHRIRKGAKRLRYTAAAMGESKVADCAKDIQTLLGDHQDSYVSRAHLVQQADAAHTAGEDTFTYGILHQQEAEVAEDARLQLDAALKALARAMSKVKK